MRTSGYGRGGAKQRDVQLPSPAIVYVAEHLPDISTPNAAY